MAERGARGWGWVMLGALLLPARAAADPDKPAAATKAAPNDASRKPAATKAAPNDASRKPAATNGDAAKSDEAADEEPDEEPDPPPRPPPRPPREARWDEPFGADGGRFGAGVISRRPWLGGETHRGLAIEGGQMGHVQAGSVRLGLSQGGTLRIFGSHDLAAGYTYDVSSSVLLGPLSLDAWLGLTTLSVDHLAGQWSAQLFSPRVGLGASVRAGLFIVGARVFSEYSWRWFGPDDRLISLGIDLRFVGHRYPLDWSEFTARGGS